MGVSDAAGCGQEAPHTPEQAGHASPAPTTRRQSRVRPALGAEAPPHLWRLLLPRRNAVLLHERKQRLLLVCRGNVREARPTGVSLHQRVWRALTCGDARPCEVRCQAQRRTARARTKRYAPYSCSARPAFAVHRTRESGPHAERMAARQTCLTEQHCGAAAYLGQCAEVITYDVAGELAGRRGCRVHHVR